MPTCRARRDVAHDCRHTLTRNYRSTPGLIDACNALFGGRRAPFLEEEIPFIPARAAAPPRATLSIGGKDAAPMVLWWHYDRGSDVRRVERQVAAAHCR